MSLERAYKNCQECYEYHFASEKIVKDKSKSIGRILNRVSAGELFLVLVPFLLELI